MPTKRQFSGYACRDFHTPPERLCNFCGAVGARRLCDYPVAKGKTCDALMCVRCGTRTGENHDLCPDHEPPKP
jgi:hypothetical protein